MADILLVTTAIDIQHSTSTVYRLYCGPYCQCNRARGTADRLLVTIAIAPIDIQHCTSTVYRLYCGPYCQYNKTRCTADRLLVTIAIAPIDIQHSTSTVYRLYCGLYCQCNRTRGTADRLLVTIAIAAIDIQHYSNSTNRHRAQYIYSVPSVLWALLSVQQGQKYGRQTIGHYSNSSKRRLQCCTNCLLLQYSYCELYTEK